jgi:ArsR family transcriptional regulator
MRGWFESAGLDLETVRELRGGALTVKFWLGRRAGSDAKKELAA